MNPLAVGKVQNINFMQQPYIRENLAERQFLAGIAVRGLQAELDLSIPRCIARRTLDDGPVVVTAHAKLDVQDADAMWVAEEAQVNDT